MRKLLLIITLGWWLAIGAIVVEHNLAPFDQSRLNWNNPTRPTAHFGWHQRPTTDSGHVIIPPGQTQRFTVRLPRGFTSGELAVEFQSPEHAGMKISAASRSGGTVHGQSATSPVVMHFAWADFTARGRQFDFAISSSAITSSTWIDRIQVIAHR
jgi:hypothetical protein